MIDYTYPQNILEMSMFAQYHPEGLGCEHYKRKCVFIAPCCRKLYLCRVCHDEHESHEMNRREVTDIICMVCRKVQKVQKTCEECGVIFGRYFCEMCRLYDDRDKGHFHCDECGLCRLGGRENFFHCKDCGICYALSLKNNHKCVKNVSMRNCALCGEDLHTSRMDLVPQPCGHLVHRLCLTDYVQTQNSEFTCPSCVK